jgi:hypothetical protein
MTEAQAKDVILNEWLFKPRCERTDPFARVQFALQASEHYYFQSPSPRVKVVLGWISETD